ncbi:hematopoietic prostaglandin D synthase-like [Ylistrum balloti]|uniref:hematopoietic prostaglandin D synthase-like n=1 Tax=Ylistrum balloti TaxID=509963 RepID=UPI002905D66B|nr:hematopoietic prostaglandin D synthase-like [Ylistrum balloti]
MPTYKLTYFNVRGRAELSRLAFALGGVKYEDVRVSSEEWKKLKPNTPQGMLPILEVDDRMIGQSGAIIREIARATKLYGKNDIEMTEVDVVLETIQEFSEKKIKAMFAKEDKDKLMKELLEETVPKYLDIFMKMLANKEYLVGDAMTVADLAVFNSFQAFAKDNKIFSKHQKLEAHAKKVESHPKVKAWLANHTPQGKLPILEVHGETIPQSRAIARYVARKHGLYGETNIDNTMVDVVIGTLQDLEVHIIKLYYEKDEEKKADRMKTFITETVPRFFKIFTEMLGENDWLVAQKLTLADIALFSVCDYLEKMNSDTSKHNIYAASPTIKKHSDRVRSVPRIKAWLDRRPTTEY